MKKRLFLAILSLAMPIEAFACSTIIGYRVPTNIELLDKAELVVLASVHEGPKRCEQWSDREFCFSRIALQPVQTLKGPEVAGLIAEGDFRSRHGEEQEPVATPLHEPHPTVWAGACIRQLYSRDALVLAMFDQHDGEWRQLGYPFARTIEDVERPDDLWPRAAQLYLQILQDTPEDQRRAAFEQERDRLRGQTDEPDAQAIADDIDRYLAATGEEDKG